MADHQNIMCKVEIQPDIQECVEIEAIPVDMQDTVETIVECGEPMIPMHSLEGQDIILEAQEEIIDDSGDPLNLYDVPVPDASEIFVESSPGPSKRRKTMKSRGIMARRDNEMLLGDVPLEQAKPRKWEQKQVQIKTMEGEFSVTMWASGASDGKFARKTIFNEEVCLLRKRTIWFTLVLSIGSLGNRTNSLARSKRSLVVVWTHFWKFRGAIWDFLNGFSRATVVCFGG